MRNTEHLHVANDVGNYLHVGLLGQEEETPTDMKCIHTPTYLHPYVH